MQLSKRQGSRHEAAEIAMVPKNTMKLEGKNAQSMQKLYDALDEHDDVQNVYGNYEMDEEDDAGLSVMAGLSLRHAHPGSRLRDRKNRFRRDRHRWPIAISS